jgi:hypothetical protein
MSGVNGPTVEEPKENIVVSDPVGFILKIVPPPDGPPPSVIP